MAKKKDKTDSFNRDKPLYATPKPIDKHDDYNGTDVGFTSSSIQNPNSKKSKAKEKRRPIDKHGNYKGTDAGFTANIDE